VSDTLLATKIHIPPLRSNLVTRPHLIKRLNDGITQNHRLTLISAPAGYGKSTLLVEWVSQLDNQVAWVSLEKGENNPLRFWNYFVTALFTLPDLHQTCISGSFLRALQSPQPPPIDSLLVDLVNDLSKLEVGVVLVLDDLHSIIEGQIHQDLVFLIDHLPKSSHGLHLVVASRMDPPWPLARWRVRDDLTELRSKDLRFSPANATTFLNDSMGLKLSTQDIALLEQRTEGWIAGLQMAALSMQNQEYVTGFLEGFSGTHRFLLDYLFEEVLSQQAPEKLKFLLHTSLLEHISAPLCNSITDCQDSQEMLLELEKSNLFLVPMDDERHWYRYHHLFSDMLQFHLRKSYPEIIPALHVKASIWYEQNGYLSHALTHAIAANDLERLIGLVKKYAFTILEADQASFFLCWLNSLPDTVMGSSPWLYLARAWLSAYLGQFEEIEPSIRESEKYANQADRRLMGYIAAMWTLMGEFEYRRIDGIPHARQALELLPQEEYQARAFVSYHLSNILSGTGDVLLALKALEDASTWSLAVGDSEMAMTAQFQRAYVLYVLGRLTESLQEFEKTFRMADSSYPDKKYKSLSVGFAYSQLSLLYLEWNNTSEALRYASEGLEICKRWGYLDYIYEALITLAEILLAIGDLESALGAIQEAKQAIKNPAILNRPDSFEAVINLARGEIESAYAWITRCSLFSKDTIEYVHWQVYLHLAVILQAQGKLSEAYEIMERLVSIMERAGAVTPLMKTLTQLIIILHNLKDDERALSLLQHALAIAKSEGYVRVFTSKGSPMDSLLQLALRRGIEKEYINQLLPAFRLSPARREISRPALPKSYDKYHATDLSDPLSDRELQVLHLLDSSLSSVAISRELYLSTHTVRTHIRNIYSKLGVHGRHEAIQKAKDTGLL
jgi:LuxR family transcriptional regulator, maltose regulon positive regulatory protein